MLTSARKAATTVTPWSANAPTWLPATASNAVAVPALKAVADSVLMWMSASGGWLRAIHWRIVSISQEVMHAVAHLVTVAMAWWSAKVNHLNPNWFMGYQSENLNRFKI